MDNKLKEEQPFLKRLTINFFLSVLIILFFQPSMFLKWNKTLWTSVGFSFLLCVVLSEGNSWLMNQMDRRMPWEKGLKKRFFTSLAVILGFSIPMAAIIATAFGVLFWNLDLDTLSSRKVYSNIVISMLVTIIVSLFFFSLNFLNKWEELAKELEQRKNKALYAHIESLQNQIKPHFLFNNLNAVTSIIPKDSDMAIQFIHQLAKVYRYILDQQQEEVVPLETEIAFAKSYIFLMEIRYKNRLKVHWEVPVKTGTVPPYVLQLLLENAIKHNVISKHKPLHIYIERTGQVLTVRNNLQVKQAEGASWGIGLNNIKERYELLSNEVVKIVETASDFIVEVPVLSMK